jgi:arabinofuranosyltransferase
MTDDGFIYLRVVRQINAGNGPVFNDGQRVEAFTGVLWVALLSVADLITPIRLEWLAVFLGIALTALGVVFAMAGAIRLHGAPRDNLYLPFGAMAFVAIMPTWIFTTSGLETGLVFAWLGTCLWILAAWSERAGHRLATRSAVVLGIGWLVRPELVAFSALFLTLVLVCEWRRGEWWARARLVAAMTALPVAYQLFRMGYFGSLVPNTAIAKEGTAANWNRGWRYLVDFSQPYALWFVALVLIIGGYLPLVSLLAQDARRRAIGVVAAYAAGSVLCIVYVVAIGGDYIHGRLLLPAAFGLGAPVAAIPAARRNLAAVLLAPWVIVALATLRPPPSNDLFNRRIVGLDDWGAVTVDDYGWGRGSARRDAFTRPAVYYGTFLGYERADLPVKPEVDLPVVAISGVGAAPFALGIDWQVVDLLGLADTLTAHMERVPDSSGARLPGHEKPLPAEWLVARITVDGTHLGADDLKPGNPFVPDGAAAAFWEDVAWARAALRCDEIVDLVRASQGAMSLGLFVENVRDALANSRMRIPRDPEAAYRKFCGDGVPVEVATERASAERG